MHIAITYNAQAFRTVIAGMDAAAAGAFRAQVASALNAAGRAAHHAIIAPLKAQTGLTGGTIPRAIHDRPADAGGLAYSLVTRGGDISLKYFGAHEGGGGVTARPRGATTYFGGAFLTSGRKGHRRKSPKLGGHVYRNVDGGRWGGKIAKVKSGVYIPQEMVRGAVVKAFEGVVAARLDPAVGRVMTLIAGRR